MRIFFQCSHSEMQRGAISAVGSHVGKPFEAAKVRAPCETNILRLGERDPGLWSGFLQWGDSTQRRWNPRMLQHFMCELYRIPNSWQIPIRVFGDV